MNRKDNFIFLTIALCLLLLGMALAQQFFDQSIQRMMQSATVITLLIVVWDVDVHRKSYTRAALFPVLIVITSLGGHWLDVLGLEYAHLILMLLFFLITAQQTAKQVLFSGLIDENKILGAICLYLLMGLIWALIYTMISLSFTNAFDGLNNSEHWYEVLPHFVYFSFVTLTTLGFGDIAPAVPIARFFVYFEAVIGQFYLTILVASLVGSHMSVRAEKHRNAARKDINLS